MAKKLQDKLNQGNINTEDELDCDTLGQVKPFDSENIDLNPTLFDESGDDLLNTLAHEYVHTQQFDTFAGKLFFGTLQGLGFHSPTFSLTEKMAYTLGDSVSAAVKKIANVFISEYQAIRTNKDYFQNNLTSSHCTDNSRVYLRSFAPS